VVTVAVIGLVLVLCAAVIGLGQVLVARAVAQSAADAAALAAAPVTFRPFGAMAGPSEEARRFAESNGARLVSCRCTQDPTWAPRTVEVEVEVIADVLGLGSGRVQAVAAAEFIPLALVP
jgi:secretion/DNA translocation related TadE-like protein